MFGCCCCCCCCSLTYLRKELLLIWTNMHPQSTATILHIINTVLHKYCNTYDCTAPTVHYFIILYYYYIILYEYCTIYCKYCTSLKLLCTNSAHQYCTKSILHCILWIQHTINTTLNQYCTRYVVHIGHIICTYFSLKFEQYFLT